MPGPGSVGSGEHTKPLGPALATGVGVPWPRELVHCRGCDPGEGALRPSNLCVGELRTGLQTSVEGSRHLRFKIGFILFLFLFYFFDTGSYSTTQARGQWLTVASASQAQTIL